MFVWVCVCECVEVALINGSVVNVEVGGQGSEPWCGAALKLPRHTDKFKARHYIKKIQYFNALVSLEIWVVLLPLCVFFLHKWKKMTTINIIVFILIQMSFSLKLELILKLENASFAYFNMKFQRT